MSKVTSVLLAGLVALGVSAPSALATDAPNQGDPSKITKVDNTKVWCKYPTPSAKVEGNFGRTISFHASRPIDFVTVKSGDGAWLVHSWFDSYRYKGTIKMSKDVSNYIVWTCPKYSH